MLSNIVIASEGERKMRAYVAAPSARKAPAVVIAQEIFGVNNALKKTADDFAEKGFLAIVPDLFWRIEEGTDLGYSDPDRQKAMALMGKFDLQQGVKDLTETMKVARNMEGCNGKVAVIGFCLGGTLAYLAAARSAPDRAVAYYGTAIHKHLDEAAKLAHPMLLHFGASDNFVPKEAVDAISGKLAGNATVHVYPGVGHAFCNVDRPGVYNAEQAQLANSRTVEFLRPLTT
jgi:carboxymethylenebutenolidase